MRATVRHVLAGTVEEIVQVRWSSFTVNAATREWSATGQIRSNVPVVAIASADGAESPSGWQIRAADGTLTPWDGREMIVSAPLRPGASDVSVRLVAPSGTSERERPPIRLAVKSVARR